MVLVWEALNFRLAYAKGQLAQSITRIGGTLTCEDDGVRASVKEAIASDIREDLMKYLGSNIVSKKELHSPIGKMGHAVGLLIIMLAFLELLWAALYATDTAGAPTNTVWTKQIVVTLQWFSASFRARS